MANDIGGHLEVYMLTPVPEDQNPSGYQRFRLPVSSKQLDGYLKRLDPKAKILPDLTTLQHKAVNIIKQHLQDENLGLGVVKLVEQRVYSTNDDTKYTPVNVVYIVLRPISKDDESMRQHQIEAIPIENAADSQPALSTSYIQIAEIMPEEGIVEGLQAELDRQPVLTKQSIAPIVTHKKKQKGKKKGKPAETSSTSSYRGSFATVHGQKEDDDKNQAAHQTQEDTRIRESFAAAAEARTSCEDSTLTSSTATLSHQFSTALDTATPALLGKVESANLMTYSPIPPSDAPMAVMTPFAPAASTLAAPTLAAHTLVPSEPASSKSVVKDSPVNGSGQAMRRFATAFPPSRKILSTSSTAKPPIKAPGDATLAPVDPSRPLFSMDTVLPQSSIRGPTTNSTVASTSISKGGHLVPCSPYIPVNATSTTATPSSNIPSTTLATAPFVQPPLAAPASAFAYVFDPLKFMFEFKQGKDKH